MNISFGSKERGRPVGSAIPMRANSPLIGRIAIAFCAIPTLTDGMIAGTGLLHLTILSYTSCTSACSTGLTARGGSPSSSMSLGSSIISPPWG